MTRAALVLALAAVAGCGDDVVPLAYRDPSAGTLRLVQRASTGTSVTLDLVVGDAPLVGYATGFDLPLDASKVALAAFLPGAALDPGPAPLAAMATIGTEEPLVGVLVVGQSQKATAHTADAMLAPGAVLLTIELALVDGAGSGVVFDGTAKGFALPSGGLLDRLGNAVVSPADVAIGTLEASR